MSDYYVVPETKLNELKQAIQAKDGSTGQLEFPDGFISKISSLAAGGASPDGLAKNTEPNGEIILSDNVTALNYYAFAGKPITKIYGKNVTTLKAYCLHSTTQLIEATFPNATNTVNTSTYYQFQSSRCQYIWLPNFTGTIPSNFAQANSGLKVIDLGYAAGINTRAFADCTSLNVIILRKTNALTALTNIAGISTNTPFKSGGAGGTIYIPKTLYDHIGDGSSLDYQSATNWATVYGYGVITWAKLEGSIYENPKT